MKKNDFAIFILTHGRADKVLTDQSLRKCGYTGSIYYVIDDEDKQKDQYIDKYGINNVFVFNKDEIGKKFDKGDNFGKKGVIIYARNVCFELAERLGITYFMELDDDYTSFAYKFNGNLQYKQHQIKDFDRCLEILLEFYQNTPCTTIAITQGGDYLGGGSGLGKSIRAKRKAMNSFICSTERPFQFVGTINEDVNTYVCGGMTGKIFLQLPILGLQQLQTQSNKGGMTETYLESGTYLKSFYSVMYQPSCCKIATMGETSKRIHHSVQWRNCTPMILSDKYKK